MTSTRMPHRPRSSGGHSCLTILLAGGQGSRLHELTGTDCKPAVPFGPTGRIVDFVVSNAAMAGLGPMMVATQYRPVSLTAHLMRNWASAFADGLILRDGHCVAGKQGYRGTADAVAANMAEIDRTAPEHVLILAGDHVFDMDFGRMMADHIASGAAATVAATPVPVSEARGFGILDADAQGQVTRFVEKPANPPAMFGDPRRSLASMGIYAFRWDWLRAALRAELQRPGTRFDFGHDILPRALRDRELRLHTLPDRPDGRTGYWRDVGTLDAYRKAQLDFVAATPPIPLPQMPGGGGTGLNAVMSGFAAQAAAVHGTVLMPGARIARGAHAKHAILGPGVVLPAGIVIGEDPNEDRRWFRRTDAGTVLVTVEMLKRREDAGTMTRAISGYRN